MAPQAFCCATTFVGFQGTSGFTDSRIRDIFLLIRTCSTGARCGAIDGVPAVLGPVTSPAWIEALDGVGTSAPATLTAVITTVVIPTITSELSFTFSPIYTKVSDAILKVHRDVH